MEDIRFKVRVSCLTYNHAPYIEDALNGFCMQETTFPFVCTIIDDASTDGEQNVINKYLQSHFEIEDPNVVRHKETDDYLLTVAQHKTNKNCFFAVLLLKYNHYSIKKLKAPYLKEWSDTEYIALCEGDDYWTDSHKLQKQVEVLDLDDSIGLVYAKARIFNQEKKCFRGTCGDDSNGFNQILFQNPVVTLTTCFRNSLYSQYIAEKRNWDSNNWKMGDYPMWIWMSFYSSFYFFDDELAVYREVEGSATHPTLLADRLAFLDSTLSIQVFFADLFHKGDNVKNRLAYLSGKNKAIACIEYGNMDEAFRLIRKLQLKDKLLFYLRIIRSRLLF